jgi:hypothetical protein
MKSTAIQVLLFSALALADNQEKAEKKALEKEAKDLEKATLPITVGGIGQQPSIRRQRRFGCQPRVARNLVQFGFTRRSEQQN